MSAGVLSQISFGLESVWGTPVVPDKSIGVQPGDGIQTDNDVQFVDSIKAQLAQHSASYKGATTHEGEYELDLIPGYVGYFIKSALGAVASAAKSAPNAAVYDHTFTEAESKPSLTIEQSVGEITRRFAGAIVHSLNFSCEPGGRLMLTPGIRAKSTAPATKIAAAYEAATIRPFTFADLNSSTGLKIGGSGLAGLRSLDFTYENNHTLLHGFGSNDPQFNYAKGSTIGGSLEFYLDTNTAAKYADYLNKTTQALQLTFTGDTIGDSANYGLDIIIPKATFVTASYPINDEYAQLTVDFEGEYDQTTSKLLSIILTNLLTNYN